MVAASREIYLVDTGAATVSARPAGNLRAFGELPAVGDWVALGAGAPQILALLPRRSTLSRKSAGNELREQVVAANVDVVLLVMGMDRDFNLNRLERFSVMAWESGAEPVAVLTKTDLAADSAALVRKPSCGCPDCRCWRLPPCAAKGWLPLRPGCGRGAPSPCWARRAPASRPWRTPSWVK